MASQASYFSPSSAIRSVCLVFGNRFVHGEIYQLRCVNNKATRVG